MDPISSLLIVGLTGGAVLALVFSRVRGSLDRIASLETGWRAPAPTDVINMARIPVNGTGGLGLMAAAFVVAINLPLAGMSLTAGLLLGTVLAVLLIVERDHNRSVQSPSEPRNSILSLDRQQRRVTRD